MLEEKKVKESLLFYFILFLVGRGASVNGEMVKLRSFAVISYQININNGKVLDIEKILDTQFLIFHLNLICVFV